MNREILQVIVFIVILVSAFFCGVITGANHMIAQTYPKTDFLSECTALLEQKNEIILDYYFEAQNLRYKINQLEKENNQ